ncbi:MAG: isochorismatase family protein [Alphaproteobacteria bacterium]|nr:isochorismatase family protein [Alphaproteobacteria bacterium]
MLLEVEDSQLVLLDYQERLLPALADGMGVMQQAMKLAQAARLLRVPIWGTEHNAQGLGPLVGPLKAMCPMVLSKTSFSAVSAGLLDLLRPAAPAPRGGNARSLPKHLQKPAAGSEVRSSIVVAGCEAHVCLLQTALELLELEVDVWVVTDACASRSERDRDAAFDRLAGAGAELLTTEMVLFEWLRDCEHPAFKNLLALIR